MYSGQPHFDNDFVRTKYIGLRLLSLHLTTQQHCHYQKAYQNWKGQFAESLRQLCLTFAAAEAAA
jgi:hypothetical protein